MAPSRGLPPPPNFPTLARRYICPQCRHRAFFTTTPPRLSGHNRWSKIKHDKAKADSRKNSLRSTFSQEIATLSRTGGPDPNNNARLADVITKAKREGFAKASIEAAIARGQGRSQSGERLESITIEGMIPVGGGSSVGVVIECETDNKARTLTDVRHTLKEAGGSATPSAYLFEKRGRVIFHAKEGVGLEEVLEAALDAGADDIVELDDEDGGGFAVWTDPNNTSAIGGALSTALNLEMRETEVISVPNEATAVTLDSPETAEQLSSFVNAVKEKEPCVQGVALNVAAGSEGKSSWAYFQS